jgi:hypothetical protein
MNLLIPVENPIHHETSVFIRKVYQRNTIIKEHQWCVILQLNLPLSLDGQKHTRLHTTTYVNVVPGGGHFHFGLFPIDFSLIDEAKCTIFYV